MGKVAQINMLMMMKIIILHYYYDDVVRFIVIHTQTLAKGSHMFLAIDSSLLLLSFNHFVMLC